MINDDLDLFFTPDVAEPVLIGSVDSQVTINAIFDNAYYAETDSGYSAQSSLKPMITCKSSDVDPFGKGTPVVVRGINYQIVTKRPDGTGITEVDLHKA